MTRVYR